MTEGFAGIEVMEGYSRLRVLILEETLVMALQELLKDVLLPIETRHSSGRTLPMGEQHVSRIHDRMSL